MNIERTWTIEESRLKRWREALDKEPSIPGDGIDMVKKDIDLALTWIDHKYELQDKRDQQRPLQMSEIKLSQEYMIRRDDDTVKSVFHGTRVTIVSKAKTRVTGVILHDVAHHKAGKRFTFYPSNLVEV